MVWINIVQDFGVKKYQKIRTLNLDQNFGDFQTKTLREKSHKRWIKFKTQHSLMENYLNHSMFLTSMLWISDQVNTCARLKKSSQDFRILNISFEVSQSFYNFFVKVTISGIQFHQFSLSSRKIVSGESISFSCYKNFPWVYCVILLVKPSHINYIYWLQDFQKISSGNIFQKCFKFQKTASVLIIQDHAILVMAGDLSARCAFPELTQEFSVI